MDWLSNLIEGLLWTLASWHDRLSQKPAAAWRWIGATAPVTWLWKFVYGKWLDDGDRVIQVLTWRMAIIETRRHQRSARMACFWIFK
jgi:hypothetical protein